MQLSSLTIAAAAALSLSACSQPERKDAGEPVEAVAEASVAGTLADLPRPKAGLWRTTTVTDGGEPDIIMQCIGPNEPMELPGGQEMDGCVDDIRRLPNGIRIDRKCLKDGAGSDMRLTMTGNFTTRSLMELDMNVNMPGVAPIKTSMRGESVYQGPCAPGQEPGLVQDGE